MILIIGGAYQGKREFAKERFALNEEDVFTCTPGKIDFSKPCIDKIEQFTLDCANPVAFFQENRELWQDSVLILEDIFCGVVPMGAEKRRWRQNTGRLAQYLAKEASSVRRIFCGLEQRLK